MAVAASCKRVEVLHVFKLVQDEAAIKKHYKEVCRLGLVGEGDRIKIKRLSKATVMCLVRA